MILAAIATAFLAPLATAADFFPLTPGTTWTYQISGDFSGSVLQKALEPTEIEGQSEPLPALSVSSQGKVVSTVFYQAKSQGVYVLGTDPSKLYATPQPVFEFGDKGTKWTFNGPSPYENDKASTLRMTGQSKAIGMRDVLGVKRECIEVKTETKIGHSDEASTTVKRTSIYAKGVGLVETQETSQFGKRQTKLTTKLAKFEPAEGSIL